jgi:hypothetical protein
MTMNISPAVRSIIIVCLMLLCEGPHAVARADIFHDDFTGPSLDASRWSLSAGGGTATFVDGRLVLAAPCGAQFPSITTVSNPFPLTGDFTFVVGFRYVDVQAGGNGLYAPNGFTYGGAVHGFQIWQDYCCANGIQVVVGEKQVRLTPPPDTNYHTYEWRYIAGEYQFFFDGNFVTSSVSSFRPTGILVGHPPYSYCPWTTQSVDYIHIAPLLTTAAKATSWGRVKQFYR